MWLARVAGRWRAKLRISCTGIRAGCPGPSSWCLSLAVLAASVACGKASTTAGAPAGRPPMPTPEVVGDAAQGATTPKLATPPPVLARAPTATAALPPAEAPTGAAAPPIPDDWAIGTPCNNPESKAVRRRLAGKNFAAARIVLPEYGGMSGDDRTFTILGTGQVSVDEIGTVVAGAKGGAVKLPPVVQSPRLQQLVTCLIVRLEQAGFFASKSHTFGPRRTVKFDADGPPRAVWVGFDGKSTNSIDEYAWIWAEQIVAAAGLRKCSETVGCTVDGACRQEDDLCSAGSSADCRKSWGCELRGMCKFDAKNRQCVSVAGKRR